jgi:magnesium transporter
MEILRAIDTERIRALRDRGEFFWLDLADPKTSDLDPLRELLTIHPLAFEDTNEFGQRAKLDHYPQSALLVVYGAAPRAGGRPRLVEVHLHISGDALVTVSREPLAALDDARRDIAARPSAHQGHAVHRVLDALADSFLDALDGFDDAIDDLQDSVAKRPTGAHRQQIFTLRRELAEMRRVLVPQRDLLAPGGKVVDAIPHLQAGEMRESFRDVHDHLDRAAGLLGSYREQLAGLLDLYLTEVSTRLNEVMKRLTMIATVFLPLSFLVGFFGMNFGWFVTAITPLWTFAVFGIGLLVASAIAVAAYLRRTGGD